VSKPGTNRDGNSLHASRIEDYAILADGQTAALLSCSGSIDWLCWPNFASGACFAALLGTADHGFWKVAPCDEKATSKRHYWPGTMIVETDFQTECGGVQLIDFMPMSDANNRGSVPSSVIRMLRGVSGRVKMKSELAIRFDYGRTVPWVTSHQDRLRAVAGSDMVVLRSQGPDGNPMHGKGKAMSTSFEFELAEGETAWLALTYSSFFDGRAEPIPVEQELELTESFWQGWIGRSNYHGKYKDAVERSLLVLKALTYGPSGGIVAAPTASLPEKIGSSRNWDYRYCWLRDTSFTLMVLLHAGYTQEAVDWRLWLLRAIAGSPDQLQTVYGICGERQLIEWHAEWLPGYERSTPVNIGNAADGQFQLDVFGEVAAALARMPQAEDDTRVPSGALLTELTQHLCDVWQEPDDGIWETRGGRKQFTYSKVSAWVALDRAIELVEGVGEKGPQDYPGADLERWKQVRAQIHAEVCEKGFNSELNSFTQSYGSKELDASCLRISLVGFLPMDDPRIVGTVEAIERELLRDGFVMRYRTDSGGDGLPAGEGAFLACSFWLVTNLWLMGREADATALFERLLSLANDVGLLSEEWDPKAGRMLGNFPQALSHIALVHSAFTLAGEWRPHAAPNEGAPR
jgi:GH15 family glucan-1,4-alpha-glucosidase